MPEIGQIISHYTIVEKLGAGGMGEVYKARDTRLERTVAIKVLKSAAAPSADLRSRFEREAKVIAALNHAHICTLFDVGRDGDADFLVMEYCEGETLAQRLAKGPLPMDQALRYGTEIAGALDKAHRAGIVHRDLKPGNIMITRSGVKLLDFGLAKLRPTGAATGELLTQATATEPLTAAGTILGTLHYMSPEQLEGKDADARADIFALGTVLYEMVTGRKAFEGSSAASVISAVMSAAPKAIASLQPLTPPALEHIVTGCLAKDPEDRRQSAADVARDLRWIAELPAESVSHAMATKPHSRAGTLIRTAAIAILGILTGGMLAYYLLQGLPKQKTPQYFALKLPADAPLAGPRDLPFGLDWPALAISPDGRRFAYVAIKSGVRQIYVRKIDEPSFRPLQGTERAVNPFFKPDGEWLGFWSDNKLKKAAFSGGSVADVCVVPGDMMLGGNWLPDGSILFSVNHGLFTVGQDGGEPEPRFTPKLVSDRIRFPSLLPDGKTVLATGNFGETKLLSLPTGVVRSIPGVGSYPSLTTSGHLVASSQGTLRAALFDAKAGKVTGTAMTIMPDVRTTELMGSQYALSDSGDLLYAPGGPADEGKLVRVDRNGNAQDLGVSPGPYTHVTMARNRDFVAVCMKDEEKCHIFFADLRRPSLLNRLTSEGTMNADPVWSPKGDRIVFESDRRGALNLWVQAPDENSAATHLVGVDWRGMSYSWSKDGLSIIFGGTGSKSNWVLKTLEIGSDAQPRVLFDSGNDVFWGTFSPDKLRLLYSANKNGVSQIYMRSSPFDTSREIQVSIQGGSDPLWGLEAKEVFYRNADRFMKVAVPDSLDAWRPEPEPMFTGNYLNGDGRPWDIMPDGQHFIMIQPTHPDPPKTELYLIQNWFEELKRLVPIK